MLFPQFWFIREKSMEFTMPSLLRSAVASAVNHTDAISDQSAEFTMPSLLRSPVRVGGGADPPVSSPIGSVEMIRLSYST